MNFRTLSLAGFFASACAFGTMALTVENLGSAYSLPALLLASLSLIAAGLMNRRLYGYLAAWIEDVKCHRRSELSIYCLALPLGMASFISNQSLLSASYMIGAGLGFSQVVPWAYCVSALVGIVALTLCALLGSSSGRKRPLFWRLSVVVGLVAVPAWCLGAQAVVSPFKATLLPWLASVRGTW